MTTASYTIPTPTSDPAGSNNRVAAIRLFFEFAILRIVPPWLRRDIGGAYLSSIGEVVDEHVDRAAAGVSLRFPNGSRTDALSLIGAERKILRGPGEDSVTYAARLRKWLDSHRTRGGAYALLEQLYEYFRASLSVPMEVVGNSGVRVLVDSDGNITRDTILWGGDGTANWARIWVMINLPDTDLPVPILDANGEPVLDGGGNPTFTDVDIFSLTDAERELLCAVPRAWSAAHIDQTRVVLLHPDSELWGYRDTTHPPSGGTVGTWDVDDPTASQVWQPTDPVIIEC